MIGCGHRNDELKEHLQVASLAEPTESGCSLKVSLLQKLQHGSFFFVTAYDLNKSGKKGEIRWRSRQFPIYYPSCLNPKIGFKQEGEILQLKPFEFLVSYNIVIWGPQRETGGIALSLSTVPI